MFDLKLRVLQQKIFEPIAKLISNLLTPNQITMLAFIVGLCVSVCLYYGHNYIAMLLFLLNRALDALDGTVARLTNQQSDFGGHLDIVTDFTVYSFIPISLTFHDMDLLSLQILPFLISTYFVNSASLFQLSSIL